MFIEGDLDNPGTSSSPPVSLLSVCSTSQPAFSVTGWSAKVSSSRWSMRSSLRSSVTCFEICRLVECFSSKASMHLFACTVPGEVTVYALAELDEGKAWLDSV